MLVLCGKSAYASLAVNIFKLVFGGFLFEFQHVGNTNVAPRYSRGSPAVLDEQALHNEPIKPGVSALDVYTLVNVRIGIRAIPNHLPLDGKPLKLGAGTKKHWGKHFKFTHKFHVL